ncbi:hypothetical protein BS47DRAFT_1400328 [Hydnum rufescens UP504]|uniref:CCHC-type domain-containing protein n=1 Tax=Hydnum rufescens UP504 TaxID=1448309 RepID=A0A9P6DNS1_9AGAM|nr:hypothetical protein BS47DRAFT_1400328 [Hydnum rufescens UP504]
MSTTTFARMPGPCSRDALRFKGKRILHFLAEYEFCTTAAILPLPKQFVKLLVTVILNPKEEEKPYYKVDHLLKLVRKDRKLSSIEKFDNYICEFMVIARALEDRKALSQTDKYDYFWRGVKPMSFREEIGNVLRNSKLWTDLTNPPPMNEATQAIKLHLKRDLYRVPDDDGSNVASDDDKSSDTMDSDDDSGTDDSDDETRRVKNRKLQSKLDNKQKKEENITKPSDITKAPDQGDPMKSNIDDLAEKIGRLTIALGQFDPDKVMRRTGKFNISSIKCFMCGEQGHSLKECPETKAFIAKKVLKISNEGRLVQLDGTDLPHGDIDNGGVARILRDQLANASNVEMEHLWSFEMLNQEFTVFGNYEYEVFPAERKQGDGEAKRNEPYVKDNPKGKKTDCPNRAYVELPQRPVKQAPPVDNPKVPTILKREAHTTEPTPALPNEDVEMRDATMDQPSFRKQKEVVGDKEVPITKLRPKTNPALEDVVENVDIEALYKTLMDKDVTVKLGDILGSSFELCKRLQVVTKTQRVPVKPETAGSHNVEATVNCLEHIAEIKDVPSIFSSVDQSPVVPPENPAKLSSAKPIELKPGRPPKQPLINRPPKKPQDHEINVVAFESDDSKNNYASDDSRLDTDDQAEQFYRRQLEKEHNRVFNVRDSDFSFRPTFLAMVTAKIQGMIMGQACTMLIDNGSELNMMVQSTQAKLELPMDPSGKDWILHGVSGHQVNLVGLCRDVPIQVGGVPLPHNFFIMSDNIGQKDIILSQPWLFSYSVRIEYAHGEGMNLQVWQDGDRQGRSVHITLPIMSAAAWSANYRYLTRYFKGCIYML